MPVKIKTKLITANGGNTVSIALLSSLARHYEMRKAVKLRAQFDLRGDRRGRWGEDEAEMVICNLILGHLIVLRLTPPTLTAPE